MGLCFKEGLNEAKEKAKLFLDETNPLYSHVTQMASSLNVAMKEIYEADNPEKRPTRRIHHGLISVSMKV